MFILTQSIVEALRKAVPEKSREVMYLNPKDLSHYNKVALARHVVSGNERRQWTDQGIVELRPDPYLDEGKFQFEFTVPSDG